MMKADLALLRQLTHGAVSVTQENDGFHFERMTEKQIHAYDTRPDLQFKVHASSGICLEFKTDCTSFTFTAISGKASSREISYFDVAVNGVLQYHAGVRSYVETPEYIHTVKLSGEVNIVTVYFPCLAKITLRDICWDGGSFTEGVTRKHTLLAFGDSITHGYDAGYPSLAYPNILGDELDAAVFNKAVGGDIFRPEVIDAEEAIHPDLIIAAYGTNDWSRCTQEVLQENAENFFSKLCLVYPSVPVCAILPIWRSDTHRSTPCGSFENAHKRIASAAEKHPQITIVDGLTLVPHLESFYSDKYLHPNEMGFLCMAKNLLKHIKKLEQ